IHSCILQLLGRLFRSSTTSGRTSFSMQLYFSTQISHS
ncbi:hypothetical protein AB1N83_014116, partial [Pleurotus pulmonarius]